MYVQSMRLVNIKAFEKLDLDFSRPENPRYSGINVFVGGNSSGKSTLLKCIAMALSGPTVATQQIISPDGWVREGFTKGLVDLQIQKSPLDRYKSTGTNTLSLQAGLEFEKKSFSTVLKAKLHSSPTGARKQSADRGPWSSESTGWFLGAYGPLRRLTGSSTEAMRYALGRGKLASCVTLFREDAALSESETWLKQEHARALEQISQEGVTSPLIDQVKEFLNAGLLPSGLRIARVTVDDVYMTTPIGGALPMRDLSDGCRSAFALILDIIHNIATVYGPNDLFSISTSGTMVVNKPGVILIDELEAHLHPAWQQTICAW